MNRNRELLVTFLMAAALVCMAPGLANAQFPGGVPGLGGGSGGKVDGKGVEKKLNELLSLTSRAIAAFSGAIGMKEEADEMTKTADCLKAGTCNGADKLSVITETGDKMTAKIADLQQKKIKLEANAGKRAAEGFPRLWKAQWECSQQRKTILHLAGSIRHPSPCPLWVTCDSQITQKIIHEKAIEPALYLGGAESGVTAISG
jgi:hypothetical protein